MRDRVNEIEFVYVAFKKCGCWGGMSIYDMPGIKREIKEMLFDATQNGLTVERIPFAELGGALYRKCDAHREPSCL